ncbi:DUF4192 family protein [Microbacterium sp. CFBP9034]|uniref:DUF4192 family protein n=1 Tax=Microbacterium sp. CFBP9034 TaxID=3096540 RepID=UPI002A6A5E00|nr:DUF4192 family protein [Microbacterium sp. CFBP9034]MDY0907887.1 DUF4192 family protein [Microbacterium sp. CFBP9034]
MTTIVKAADAAEFLSLIPCMLGYVPTRSLVLIPFAGSRSLGAMRFDLPDGGEPDAVDRISATVIGMVCRLPDADAVAAITYTDERISTSERMPHLDLIDALGRRADACGLRTADALCVAADGWGSFLDPECPAEGRPLAALEAVSAPVEGLPDPCGDQASGAELPVVGLAQTERVAHALLALGRAVEVLCGTDGPGPNRSRGPAMDDAVPAASASASGSGDPERIDPRALAAVCALDDLPALFEQALTWQADELEPYDAAALVWCLARPSLRDIALVQWSGTLAAGDEAFDAQLRWEAGEEYPVHLAMQLWGEGERPDADRLERALQLTRHVAACAPRDERPGALAMCAWLSWALGRSTHAEVYALEACDIEPEHGLSEIVSSFVHAGHLPDWAFRRSADGRTASEGLT